MDIVRGVAEEKLMNSTSSASISQGRLYYNGNCGVVVVVVVVIIIF